MTSNIFGHVRKNLDANLIYQKQTLNSPREAEIPSEMKERKIQKPMMLKSCYHHFVSSFRASRANKFSPSLFNPRAKSKVQS